MTNTPKVLVDNVQLGTSIGTLGIAVPANALWTISACTLNNTTGTARTVTLRLVRSGATSGSANELATNLVIPASGNAPTVVAGMIGQHLAAGGMIQGSADAASAVTVYISGYERT